MLADEWYMNNSAGGTYFNVIIQLNKAWMTSQHAWLWLYTNMYYACNYLDSIKLQWSLFVTTTSMIKSITCDLFSNVFKWKLKVTIHSC